ncbi:MAG: 2-phosphosulfolactate phosphatase [Acidimicrobiia bacterium]|nr:2-phosphosulfolactate phosphatase [Acidimicrobiia bacterium]
MTRQVFIDVFEDGLARQPVDRSLVVVDVIRASTTAITAVAAGHRCFPATSLDDAARLASELTNPLLAGELGGHTPFDFDLGNSPASLMALTRRDRPLVLLSSSGTSLMVMAADRTSAGYVGSLRNLDAMVTRLITDDRDVALIGAGSRGEFREEDQYGCARIAEGLVDRGWEPGDPPTASIHDRWRAQPVESFLGSRSVDFLRKTNQTEDLDFILDHVDDLPSVFRMSGRELVSEAP